MALQALLWIGLAGVSAVFMTIISSEAFKRIKIERNKKKCCKSLTDVINDAASMYENITTRQNVVRGQDDIDLSLLISVMNKIDLDNLLAIYGIKPESLKLAIGFKPEVSEKECSVILEDTLKTRIFEYCQKEFGSFKYIGPEKLFLALANGHTVNELIRNAQHIEDGLPESTYRIKEKPKQFYPHAYPTDEYKEAKQL